MEQTLNVIIHLKSQLVVNFIYKALIIYGITNKVIIYN